MVVAFVTFGCRLNRAEALDLEARVRALGHTVADLSSIGHPPPDLIVVRGCSVTARAERDSLKALARLRSAYPLARIVPTGCLRVREALPFPAEADDAPVPMATSRAYLKVQDGCSGACAYCTVPKFRGAPVSVPFDAVLRRARAFLAAGYREIVVTGCNLALWREGARDIADLVSALAELTLSGEARPVHRVRVGSLEPGLVSERLLAAFAAHENICRFLHLSLQSAADPVLRAMRRPYVRADAARFCRAAVRLLGPHVALGADVIAGFPGETEEDHRETVRFFSEGAFPFSRLHVFPYSERPGTVAATLSGALPRAVRIRRARELERVGRANRAAFAATFVGREVEVCVEKGGGGWTEAYLRCPLPVSYAPRRHLVRVIVAGARGGELVAKI